METPEKTEEDSSVKITESWQSPVDCTCLENKKPL